MQIRSGRSRSALNSDRKCGFSQPTEGIQTSSINMIWLFISPSLCQKMVEIGPVVFEIWDQMWCEVGRWWSVRITARSLDLFFHLQRRRGRRRTTCGNNWARRRTTSGHERRGRPRGLSSARTQHLFVLWDLFSVRCLVAPSRSPEAFWCAFSRSMLLGRRLWRRKRRRWSWRRTRRPSRRTSKPGSRCPLTCSTKSSHPGGSSSRSSRCCLALRTEDIRRPVLFVTLESQATRSDLDSHIDMYQATQEVCTDARLMVLVASFYFVSQRYLHDVFGEQRQSIAAQLIVTSIPFVPDRQDSCWRVFRRTRTTAVTLVTPGSSRTPPSCSTCRTRTSWDASCLPNCRNGRKDGTGEMRRDGKSKRRGRRKG